MPRARVLYSAAIALGSLLLFAVQPMVAKAMLPRFGGSAGVWVTCMLFFQVVLLAGYLYAFVVTRYLSARAQRGVQLLLLVVSLWAAHVKPAAEWTANGTMHPAAAILGVLAISVGVPYFALSTNSPLMQAWYAGTGQAKFPYGLFAWSNAASLTALLLYPVAIEPLLDVERQLRWWFGGYVAWAALVAVAAMASRGERPASSGYYQEHRPWLWVALAACASTLWLALANHLSQQVAAIPFLWVLPLSVYLLTFILCFEGDGFYNARLFRWLVPAACVAVGYMLQAPAMVMQVQIPVYLAALFIWCMFCHGELAAGKPETGALPYFYLMLALGGALGAVFVAVVAPAVFDSYVELPLGVTACVLLALRLLFGLGARRLIRLAVVAVVAFALALRFQSRGDVLHTRNFYGTLQVIDAGSGELAVRSLFNGQTLHGRQYLRANRSRVPLAFYGTISGIGRVMESPHVRHRRVAIIGLGVGAIAAYGRTGDQFRFYEINPAVVDVARRQFTFLEQSDAATDVVVDDGRLAIERELPATFDLVVVDAFSDDSVPVHLLTREAFNSYFARLRENGVLVLHLSNRYLDLARVVEGNAAALGKQALLLRTEGNAADSTSASEWAVVTENADVLRDLAPFAVGRVARPRIWTDARSNLFEVLR